ncbi:ATP-binding response regulator [Celerinatantimonas diazotrophica]|uniref:histidine kinase n=1 Tax=Celerinatantimonas diazotrophica TaxID=412034 RepID=A0A4R1JA45_9GAMM|nr:hybrid sensor histidine kinase/response regulator [Celerinatantimonas diazotrophica]TCK47337.1 two-component system CAI-1 autoinducer sensor kinase/phosphatase CqsS [Celerinatantimonas diazotrophica]CAG9295047.1 CAI-1 autoinducer sensor kinase/phosphatase CqsS [Celerinatantimonas diazotrophica]
MNAIKKIYTTSESNLTVIGWLGFFGYPVYYLFWHYLYPQPYDSLLLRSFCSLCFLPLALHRYWPEQLRKWLPYYYVVTIGIGLPFFFSFMMLMNNWSDIWAMSLMAALFLHILTIYDTKILVSQAIFGFFIAYLCAFLIKDGQLDPDVKWSYVPIFLFAYIFGTLCYVKNKNSNENKISTTKSFGAGIAHEMRNPLSALKHSLYLSQDLIKEQPQNKEKLDQIFNDSINIIDNALETIEILLTSIDETRISTSSFKLHSIAQTLNKVTHSFSYNQYDDQKSVHLEVQQDFSYLGSESLLIYTFYNLMKNAFHYKENNEFHIFIQAKQDEEFNRVIFRDNGQGIDKKELKYIFDDFYTNGKNNGFGLGLPFCKRVMRAFHGDILCRSVFGQWTEFELVFPKETSPELGKLKDAIISHKEILYITDMRPHQLMSDFLFSNSKFPYQIINSNALISEDFYTYRYDLTIVDLDKIDTRIKSKINHKDNVIYLSNDTKQTDQANVINYQDFIKNYQQIILNNLLSNDKHVQSLRPPTEPVNGKSKILVVDDNQSVLKLTSLLLEHNGFITYQASEGADAIRMLDNGENIDIIIMDLEMPAMDGLETTRKIRASQKKYNSIPIIGHTGDDQSTTINKILTSGMNDYIIKPSNKTQLINKLQLWI